MTVQELIRIQSEIKFFEAEVKRLSSELKYASHAKEQQINELKGAQETLTKLLNTELK